MKPKICRNCGHLEEEHQTRRLVKFICKHQRWDTKQELFMPCNCKEFGEEMLIKEIKGEHK